MAALCIVTTHTHTHMLLCCAGAVFCRAEKPKDDQFIGNLLMVRVIEHYFMFYLFIHRINFCLIIMMQHFPLNIFFVRSWFVLGSFVRSHNFRHVFSILIFHTPFIYFTSRFRFDSFSFSVCVLLLFGKLFGFQTLHKRITVDFANILFIAISSWLFFGSRSNSFWPYFVLKIQCVQKIYTKYFLFFSRWWMMVLGEKLQKKYIM